MSFVSSTFILFLAVVFIAYYATPKKYRWAVLLAASYFFYLTNSADVFFYIVITTCSVFFAGILIDKVNNRQKTLFDEKDVKLSDDEKKRYRNDFAKQRKRIVAFALLLNFGILALLKYANFIIENINAVLPKMSVSQEIPYLNLLIPLGVSFYTFQSMGYIIDVYRGKYPADRNLAKFALFVSFFPQIVQGPISRYDQLAHQLAEGHDFNIEDFKYGVQLIIWGFFKKLVIADRAGILVDNVLRDYTQYQGAEVGFAVFIFMMQVYADFSGGMDIARGVARCLGIDLVRNFNRPYFATSIADYWRRWHITLGAWMKEYLLYSITFSKGFAGLIKWSKKHLGAHYGRILPTCCAMALVFFTVGIWHGAGWKYIMFGVYNGGLIAIGILMGDFIDRMRVKYPGFNIRAPLPRVLITCGTVFLVYIGRFFSAADGVRQAVRMIISTFSVFNPGALFGDYFERTGLGYNNFYVLSFALAMLFVVSLLQERGVNIRETFSQRNMALRWCAYFFVIMFTMLFGIYGAGDGGFIYQRF